MDTESRAGRSPGKLPVRHAPRLSCIFKRHHSTLSLTAQRCVSGLARLRFGYVCGALRVTTDEAGESHGPRAHVVGFLEALESNGVTPRRYLAGDAMRARGGAVDPNRVMGHGRLRNLAVDGVRLAMRYEVRARAQLALGPLDIVYERLASFHDVGRPYKRRGSAWIVESNGPFWHEAAEDRQSLALRSLARRIEIQAYRDASLIVAVSEPLRDILVEETGRDPADILVLPNAVDQTRFNPATVAPRRFFPAPVVGFVGYLTEWAGLSALLRAIADLMRSDLPVNLVVVGDGPQKERLVQESRGLGLAANVTFTGRVPWSDVPSLMAGFDIAFSGQIQTTIGAMYHSPLKLYEYQAMGLPIVASDFPDARSLLEGSEAGWLFTPGDDASLARALRAAIAAPDLAERGARGRAALLERDTWDARVKTFLDEISARKLL